MDRVGTGRAEGAGWPWDGAESKPTRLFLVALLFPSLEEVLSSADSNRVNVDLVSDHR